MRTLTLALVSICLTLAACDAGDGTTATGDAPTIADLTLATTAKAGEQTTVSGQLTFSDPDGDVSHIAIDIRQGSLEASVPESPIANAAGVTSGAVPFAFAVLVPTSGTATVEVRLIDAAGHDSNVLSAELTVE